MKRRMIRPAAILGGVRIPFCRAGSDYATAGNHDMLVHTVGSLTERYNLQGEVLGDVTLGAVMKWPKDWNLSREVVLGSGLSPLTPGLVVTRACGTSLDAAGIIANRIGASVIEVGIAGGSDTISDLPLAYQQKFARRLLAASRAKDFMGKLRAFKGFGFGELKPAYPTVAEPRTGLSMGQHTEIMAKDWQISREDQDRFAYESHMKAAKAYHDGFFDDLVVPFRGVERDNILRPNTSLEKLADLKPAFDHTGKGTLTAGNSSPLTDGASCALLASESWAKAHSIPVQAYLTHTKLAAVDYVSGEGLLMAPAIAISELLKETGLSLQDFDYYEIHEAFAAQVLCLLRAFESKKYCKDRLGRAKPLGSIDPEKINVKGSSLAVGHPFAATGTRIVASAAKLLREKGAGRVLISICTAGGMGVVAIVERPGE